MPRLLEMPGVARSRERKPACSPPSDPQRRLANYDAAANLLRVRQEVLQRELFARIEGRLISLVNEVTGLLKLNGNVEGRGNVDAPDLAAGLGGTFVNLILPETQSGRI